jgi:hypothetical protein
LPKQNTAENNFPPAGQEIIKEISPTQPENIEISISENEFTPSGFSIYANKKTIIMLTNSTDKPRNFEIEGLNIKIDQIEPQETKEINLESLPNELASYKYKSSTSDGEQPLTGILMVLKK